MKNPLKGPNRCFSRIQKYPPAFTESAGRKKLIFSDKLKQSSYTQSWELHVSFFIDFHPGGDFYDSYI